jgi:hypothetical protein
MWPFTLSVRSSVDGREIVTLSGPHSSTQKTLEDWRDGVGFNGTGVWSREAAIEEVRRIEADAVLIAAAPDLLATLKQFVLDHEMSGMHCAGLNATYFQALAVIKKAEGR